ncbi:ACT domain-containing protein ACR8-like [Zingiber officinale]|uniref:ACT domain-containing protein ACR8-like n=1 Tax=Zingiber officinale TaxID=94328 RepID=UPI001C4BE83F|nr:ACT domain-containing protein ACR8-like [Zingiber officinale]
MEHQDEYQKLVSMMSSPRVEIDNTVSSTATVVSVNNARNSVKLLDTVRVLTDLNLSIQKGYISFDGCWFLDVFHVTDERGHKILDPVLLSHIEHSIVVGEISSTEEGATGLMALELTGVDRPGLLSEVCGVLRDLKCNVVEAKMWTHNARIACLVFVNDHHSGLIPTALADRHPCILTRLRKVLSGSAAKATVVSSSPTLAHSDRRLHQLMFRDRCDEEASSSSSSSQSKLSVSVQRLAEHGYSVVNVQCPDRPKLLFDVVCTLTDMDYVVFHGKFGVDADRAFQEFYIRRMDGSMLSSETERQRVIHCVQAAIERRASEGVVRLALRMPDRRGLLAEVTRVFRENGLMIRSVEIATKNGEANDEFCVTDISGRLPDSGTVNAVIDLIGEGHLIKLTEQSRS